MPSPDASPYVDLRLFDKDSQDVFTSALVNLQSYLPEWEPREGHTEVLLMESLALEVSETVFAINRVPGAVVEVLLRLYGIERDLGTAPTTTLTFTLSDTTGHDLPAGVRAALILPGGEDPVVFTTTEPLTIPAGADTGSVAAVGDRNTAAANGTITATALDLLDAIVFVERVTVGSTVTGGADAEDDEAWFSRGILRFSRLVETLVLPRHFVAAALERPEVSRAFAVDNYDPAQAGAPGSHAGHVTTAVLGDGAVLSPAQRETIRAVFDMQAQANLAVHIIDPTITPVDVSATVVAKPGFSETQVRANCIAALTSFLSPQLWPWSATVYRNELIALLDTVEGVQRVDTISTPGGDVALTGVAPLATLGAVTITVAVP